MGSFPLGSHSLPFPPNRFWLPMLGALSYVGAVGGGGFGLDVDVAALPYPTSVVGSSFFISPITSNVPHCLSDDISPAILSLMVYRNFPSAIFQKGGISASYSYSLCRYLSVSSSMHSCSTSVDVWDVLYRSVSP